MDNKNFDNIVKEQLENLQVAPSEGVKKALAGAMFYRNLWFFHKVKLIAAVLVVSGGTYLGLTYSAEEEGQMTNTAGTQVNQINSPEKNLEDNQLSQNTTNKQELTNLNTGQASSFEMGSDQLENKEVLNASNQGANSSAVNSEGGVDYASNNQGNNSSSGTAGTTNNKGEDQNANSSGDEDMAANASKGNPFAGAPSQNKNVASGVNEDHSIENNSTSSDLFIAELKDGVYMEAEEVEGTANLTQVESPSMPNPEDYVYEKPTEGLSFDVYYSPYNMTDIDNSLDANLEQYWWDFYSEFDYVQSGNNLGLNVNYDWRNIRLGTGISTSTLYDYKPVYEYLYDDYTFAPLGGHVISGAMVYGQQHDQDTALIFYVDPADQKLIDEFENDYNSFTYLKVPLTLGYKLDFKYASLEVNGGIEWNRLMRAKGQSVKVGQPADESFPIYFYEDRYMTSFSKNREVLNKNILGLTASATLRVRLTPNFDLYSSANFNQGKQGVYVKDYFMQKTYRNYGLKFGLTYYISRRLTVNELTHGKF